MVSAIVEAMAPIYLVREVDVGCRIGVLTIICARSSGKILATLKSEMANVVFVEEDDTAVAGRKKETAQRDLLRKNIKKWQHEIYLCRHLS